MVCIKCRACILAGVIGHIFIKKLFSFKSLELKIEFLVREFSVSLNTITQGKLYIIILVRSQHDIIVSTYVRTVQNN
jgi:hypothetical protein